MWRRYILTVALFAFAGAAGAQPLLPGSIWALITSDNDVLLAGTSTQGVFASADLGQSFVPLGPSPAHIWALQEIPGALLAAGEPQPLWASFDDGATWTPVEVAPNLQGWGYDLAHDPVRGRVFLASWGGGVFYAPAGDVLSWTNITANLPESALPAVAVNPATGTVASSVYGNTIWRLVNNTIQWQLAEWDVAPSAQPTETFALEFGCDVFLAGTWGDGAYVSADDAVSFKPFGLDDLYVYDFAFTSTCDAYAATNDGLWRRTLADPLGDWVQVGFSPQILYSVTVLANDRACVGSHIGRVSCMPLPVSAEGDAGRAESLLAAPFPNPVSAGGSATFEFALAGSGTATLTVYDLLGREVARLAEGFHGAGAHTASWRPSGVSAGAYVVRLVTPEGVQTRRIVVH